MRRVVRARLLSLVVAAAFVGLWQLAANYRVFPPTFLPGPYQSVVALWKGLAGRALLDMWIETGIRMLVGWLLASLLGIVIGTAISLSSRLEAYLAPTLEFLRPLPASAILPLAISIFGLSETTVLVVIAFAAIWPVLLNTYQGVKAVEPQLVEVSRSLELPELVFVRKIALPASMPQILSGMRLGLTTSLIITVVGEMLAGLQGLGGWILAAARNFRGSDLFAGVILLGVTGLLCAAISALMERAILGYSPERS